MNFFEQVAPFTGLEIEIADPKSPGINHSVSPAFIYSSAASPVLAQGLEPKLYLTQKGKFHVVFDRFAGASHAAVPGSILGNPFLRFIEYHCLVSGQ